MIIKKMKAIVLSAKWDPKQSFKIGDKDIEGKLTYLGSKVWRFPSVKVVEKERPIPRSNEVLIQVKRCGISESFLSEP